MLSIQKITGFVNDCVTFRQKTTFYATSSGLFSTRALVRPSGRISPAAVSGDLGQRGACQLIHQHREQHHVAHHVAVRELGGCGSHAQCHTGLRQQGDAEVLLDIITAAGRAISEREERKGRTQRSQKKRIYVQYTIRPDKKQPEYGAPAKSSGRANKRNSFRHRCAMPPIPLLALSCHLPRPGESFSRREALARRRGVPFCQRLPL